MPKSAVTCTIPAGEALSSSVDLQSAALGMLLAPVTWSPASYLTFQISADGNSWADLFDASGNELSRAIAPATGVVIDPEWTESALFLRLRSGSRAAPVVQEADAVFTLVLI